VAAVWTHDKTQAYWQKQTSSGHLPTAYPLPCSAWLPGQCPQAVPRCACQVVGEKRCPIVDTWWQTETAAHMILPLPGGWTEVRLSQPPFHLAMQQSSGCFHPPCIAMLLQALYLKHA
jgi:hypothetical protein